MRRGEEERGKVAASLTERLEDEDTKMKKGPSSSSTPPSFSLGSKHEGRRKRKKGIIIKKKE